MTTTTTDTNAPALTDAQIDELLTRLDDLAMNVDAYTYGLPLYDAITASSLRQIVRAWLPMSGAEVSK